MSWPFGHGVGEAVLLPDLARLEPLHHPHVLAQQVVQCPVVVEGERAAIGDGCEARQPGGSGQGEGT